MEFKVIVGFQLCGDREWRRGGIRIPTLHVVQVSAVFLRSAWSSNVVHLAPYAGSSTFYPSNLFVLQSPICKIGIIIVLIRQVGED